MKGMWGQILTIDLSTQKCEYEKLDESIYRKYLGGKGLGIYLLTERLKKNTHPLSPENLFIIATGPATTTNVWGQNRYAVISKSPATNGYGESYCGGKLAPKIKGIGVDAIILRGKAKDLTYLVLGENKVEFKSAKDIKGMLTNEAEKYMLDQSPKGSGAMTIGPAGENLVACAAIKSDIYRSIGRGGMGAVLGSKNIKGIVFCGNKKTPVHNQDILKQLNLKVSQIGKESPVTPRYQKLGTPMQVEVLNMQKCFPTRYWTKGYHEKWKNISAIHMQENFELESVACPPCFLKCTKKSKILHGKHQGLELEGPEFETIYAIGGLNELDSLEEVAYLNDLCDKLGIDTMSAGNLAGFATEAYKRGKSDFAIDYNQPEKIAILFKMIANREGLGNILADGIKPASEKLGLEDLAIHVKGLEPGGFDPRILKGMGLSYATSPRGACHLRGTFYKAELSGQMSPNQIQGKALLHIDYEDRAALFDCMILCRFYRDFILWNELSMLLEGTTGFKYNKEELQDIANNITQMTRKFNHREGLGPETDTLPKRFLEEKTAEGASLSREDLQIMLDEYNAIRDRI